MHIKLSPPPGVTVNKVKIPSQGRRMPALVIAPPAPRDGAPGVLWIHGGGYITGMKEMVYMSRAMDLVTAFGAVVISPGYRLAPFHPYPAAIEDCYAALLYLRDNAASLGVNPSQLMVGGESAGGGLTAALTLIARDRGEVRIAYQMPLYPMIDHLDTDSSRDNHGRIWNTCRNHLGWRVYLRGTSVSDIPAYASPAHASDLSGLPPCYTFVGDGEPFYSETLSYVDRLRAAGVEASADVYHTDTHAFDMLYPSWEVSRAAIEAFRERFEYAVGNYFAEN